MKYMFAFALAVWTFSAASAAEKNAFPLHKEARLVPELKFKNEAGADLTLKSFRGKVVVLNLWATWCTPCRKEMPTLDRLQALLGGDKFHVLALSIDSGGLPKVRKFFKQIGVKHLSIYIDQSGQALRTLAAIGLPTTLLLSPDGRELGRLPGPAEWDEPEKVEFFRQIIKNYQTKKGSAQ